MNELEQFYEHLDKSNYDSSNEHDINSYLQKVGGQLAEKGLSELVRLSELERQVFALRKSFEYEEEKKRLVGIQEQFKGVSRNELGEEVEFIWPDVSLISQEDYEYIENRYKEAKNLFAKTEYGTLLYFQKPSTFSKHTDFKRQLSSELFELAKQYQIKAESPSEDNSSVFSMIRALKSALAISLSIKFTELTSQIVVWLTSIHKNWAIDRRDSLRVLLDITRILTDNYRIVKDDFDVKEILNKNLIALEVQEKKYIWGAIYIIDESRELDQKAGINLIDYRLKKAQLYELLADEAEGTPRQLAAISFVEKALRIYREVKDEPNIKRLEDRYQAIRGSGNFSTIKTEIDSEHVNTITENIKKEVQDSDVNKVLVTFVQAPMFSDIETIRESAELSFQKNLSLNLFSSSVADKFGNTVATYNSEEERKTFAFWQTFDFHYQVGVQWLIFYFMEAFNNEKISLESVVDFLRNTWLNEPLPRDSAPSGEVRPLDILTPPLQLFFSELQHWKDNPDYIINTVVLNDSMTLKIEAILRYMCERIGISTFRIKEHGIVMEKNLDELLADLQHKDDRPTGFEENDRLFIKFVLSEKMGQNLRNRTAHGLLDIYEYSFENLVVIFSIIIRLSKYEMN